MIPFRSTILALPVWLWAVMAFGSSDLQPYRVDSWQVNDGLPQSSVLAIVQTHDGYLWLGTAGGLVRFDGVQFKVFTPNNTPGLPGNRILSLFEDSANTLWIGTSEGYLVRDSASQFQVISPPGWVKLSGYIQSLAETPDGKLWLLSPEKTLVRFPKEQAQPLETNFEVLQAGVNCFAATDKGRIWFATDREVSVWSDGQVRRIIELPATTGYSPVVLARSRDGGCWVAANGRLRKFKEGDCTMDYGNYPWSKGSVVRMVEDHTGQLWVGTYGSGLYCYTTNHTVLHFSKAEGLPGDFIRSMGEDREGNVWVGTDEAGLARVKPVVFQGYTRDQGLAGDCVNSVCEGADGELWIGLIADGVDRLKDGVVKHYGTAQGLPNDFVHSIFVDRKHILWAGTWGGGLCRMEGDGFVPFANPGECSGVVCALFEDLKGDLWVGQQRSSPEIVRLENEKPVVFQLPSRLAGTDVRALAQDRDGNVWIGTQGDGLFRIKSGQQTHFGRHEGLNNEAIRSLFVDVDGVLWISTFGGGLNRFKDGKFTSFTTKAGLVSDYMSCVMEDGRGNLWCGSLGGVFRVSKRELDRFTIGENHWIRCLPFTTSDGLPSMECIGGSQPSGCKTRDGRLWFPTAKGLAVVDPENVPVNQLQPPVAIEQVVIEGKERRTIDDVAISSEPDRPSRPLKIEPGVQRLEFHYTGLSLTEPKKVRFKYKLEGAEDDWVEAGTVRSVNYSHLQPGAYRFRVQACNNDGVWNEHGTAVSLVILPHFWQTWWFKALCAAAVMLLFVVIYEIRLASERKLARVRMRIASDLHDEVGSNLGSIALLSELRPRNAEELDEIRRVALETVASLREIVWFLDPAGDNMHDLILRMKDTARTMLHGIPFDFVVEGDVASIHPSLDLRRNLYPMFKEILHNIAKHARANQVKIRLKRTGRQFQICIKDDGVGFDVTLVSRGNGLKNLRRRAADLRGELQIQSRPGSGAHFTVTMPVT